jgi:serine/threonine-protein kinase
MLTGRLPFTGGSPQSIVAQHVALEPPPIRHYAPHVPEEVARVIDRCLAKKPAQRWADAGAFGTALLKAQRVAGRRRWNVVRLLRRVVGR